MKTPETIFCFRCQQDKPATGASQLHVQDRGVFYTCADCIDRLTPAMEAMARKYDDPFVRQQPV